MLSVTFLCLLKIHSEYIYCTYLHIFLSATMFEYDSVGDYLYDLCVFLDIIVVQNLYFFF